MRTSNNRRIAHLTLNNAHVGCRRLTACVDVDVYLSMVVCKDVNSTIIVSAFPRVNATRYYTLHSHHGNGIAHDQLLLPVVHYIYMKIYVAACV